MDSFLLVLFVVGFPDLIADSITSCHNGWIAYEGSCYYFDHDAVHFTEAEQYCRQRNSHLIHIDNMDENNFIKDKLRDMKISLWWLGLTDETTEGQWVWFDTDDIAIFTDWAPGEPNSNVEDCAAFCDCHDFQWGDIACTANCHAVCENSAGGNVVIG